MLQIVITDLDGTLLDHETYDYSAARPALKKLQEKSIPLILCSSKTAAEIIPFRLEIHNKDPFIVENGGGIFIPEGYFSTIPFETRTMDHFLVISRTPPYSELRQALHQLTDQHDLTVESFDQMSASRLAVTSGLSEDQAKRSLQREFDLPFRILSKHYSTSQLAEEIQKLGLRLTQGVRFFHLGGDIDKGQAVAQLIDLYRTNHGGTIYSIGLGDSQNDLSMLKEVQIPVIIENPHSAAPLASQLPHARTAQAPGPQGWNEAVLSLLEDF